MAELLAAACCAARVDDRRSKAKRRRRKMYRVQKVAALTKDLSVEVVHEWG